jgi:polyketide cyclase/dehydrase/lipid transport protein
MREVGLEFLATAPVRLVFEARVPARRDKVFAAVTADPATWSWFPTLSSGSYEGTGPYGVGSGREVRAAGVRYRETIMAWEEPTRWAYRINESSAPMNRALLENWEFEDVGDRTLVRWTFAADPRLGFRVILSLGRTVVGWVFRRAMHNLGAQLSARPAPLN